MSRANEWARCNAKTPFSVYQGQWSILKRDFERDIIPMARAEGMALVPWDVLGGGKIRSDEQEQQREKTGENGKPSVLVPHSDTDTSQAALCSRQIGVALRSSAESVRSCRTWLPRLARRLSRLVVTLACAPTSTTFLL